MTSSDPQEWLLVPVFPYRSAVPALLKVSVASSEAGVVAVVRVLSGPAGACIT